MKKSIVVELSNPTNFTNAVFVKFFEGFDISVNKTKTGYRFLFEVKPVFDNIDFLQVAPVEFDTPITKTDVAKPLVSIFFSQVRWHNYSKDLTLNEVVHNSITEYNDEIEKTITELVESVILDEKD